MELYSEPEPIENNDAHSLENVYISENTIFENPEKSIRDSFIHDLGELAYKYICSESNCRTNSYEFFSKITEFYDIRNATSEERGLAREVFKNEYRIKKFFSENFHFLKIIDANLEDMVFFYLDPNVYYEHIFSIPSVLSSLELFSPKKPYLDSLLDGKKFKNIQHNIHLSLYVDDFDPLIKSVYNGRSVHKVTGIYLKILNLSPNILSKRDLVFPFSVFSCENTHEKKKLAYEFASNILKEFTKREFNVGGRLLNFKISVCCSDNLAAHELLGLSTPTCSHPCRFCSEKLDSFQVNFDPIKPLYRTPENIKCNYKAFIALNKDSPALKHCDGVKGLPLIKYFPEITDPFNFPSCISHDIFEKVVPDVLMSTLQRLKHEKMIDFAGCIKKLMNFKLSSSDKESPFVIANQKISGSSSQMRTLMRLFKYILRNDIPFESDLSKGIILVHDIFFNVKLSYFLQILYSQTSKTN